MKNQKNDIENQNFAIFADYVSDSVHNFRKIYAKKIKKCFRSLHVGGESCTLVWISKQTLNSNIEWTLMYTIAWTLEQ